MGCWMTLFADVKVYANNLYDGDILAAESAEQALREMGRQHCGPCHQHLQVKATQSFSSKGQWRHRSEYTARCMLQNITLLSPASFAPLQSKQLTHKQLH